MLKLRDNLLEIFKRWKQRVQLIRVYPIQAVGMRIPDCPINEGGAKKSYQGVPNVS